METEIALQHKPPQPQKGKQLVCMRGWNKKLIYKMVDFQASFLKPLSMLNGINRFQLVLTFYRDIKGSYYMLKSSGWG